MTDTPLPIEIIKTIDHAMDILHDLYSSPGAQVFWLTSEQPLLNGQVPLNLIKEGRGDEVIAMLNGLVEGVYI